MKKIIVVADMFSADYGGGAELTTDAIISYVPNTFLVERRHCKLLTAKDVNDNLDAHWVVCNFASLEDHMKVFFCKNLTYSIIEYDYKFCVYRSLEKHLASTGKECDCLDTSLGKLNKAFYGYAQNVWFMSDKQRNIFLDKLDVLKDNRTHVLSSIFNRGNLRFMQSIKDNLKNEKYLILGSNSWIKGTPECVKYAQDNELEYEVISGLPYHEMLIKLSTSKGLIFRPLGDDTCPRIVIEAKLLGCDLKLNEHVQHKDEDWFKTAQGIPEYIESQMHHFWGRYE
ncbi:MAG TPA: hypothetical protein EYN67_09330 [Flavobacteriales bacterium]|nr:hypothetical protein [Flavobacteriales bacterium]